MNHVYILNLSCPDRPGIVHAVSGFLFERGGNIEEAAQFNDQATGLFFMRVHFSAEAPVTLEKLHASFAATGDGSAQNLLEAVRWFRRAAEQAPQR